MIERQEIQCHNCMMFVQFDLDFEIDGNHVLECPECGHEHCRVITDGKITGDRWDSRNGSWTNVSTTASYTLTSTMMDYLNNTAFNVTYSDSTYSYNIDSDSIDSDSTDSDSTASCSIAPIPTTSGATASTGLWQDSRDFVVARSILYQSWFNTQVKT